MKAMILAAGAGTRLDPLTLQIPKPLVPIVNRPVMDHTLHLLQRHGFNHVWANLYYLPDLIRDYFNQAQDWNMELNYFVEEELSGDAGGVRACRSNLCDSTLLVIMGDLLTSANLSDIVTQHKNKGALATIALKAVDDVSQFGVAVIDKQGWIKEFQEKPNPKEAKSNLASTGIYVLEPSIFDHIPAKGKYGFGKELFPDLVRKNLPVLGIEIKSYWSDVGTLEQYKQANFDALDKKIELDIPGKFKENSQFDCFYGENVDIKKNCNIEGKILLGNNVTINESAKLSGHVIIGDNAVIETGAEIKDSIIWAGSNIGKRAKIESSVLGLNSDIQAGEEINGKAFVMPRQSGRRKSHELLSTYI